MPTAAFDDVGADSPDPCDVDATVDVPELDVAESLVLPLLLSELDCTDLDVGVAVGAALSQHTDTHIIHKAVAPTATDVLHQCKSRRAQVCRPAT